MTKTFYHIQTSNSTIKLYFQLFRIHLFQILLEQASFDQSLGADKQYKFALFILGQLPKLIHADSKIGSGFFNGQVRFSQIGTSCFIGNILLFHRLIRNSPKNSANFLIVGF